MAAITWLNYFHTGTVVEALVQQAASLMTLSGNLVGLNLAGFQSWSLPFNAKNGQYKIISFFV